VSRGEQPDPGARRLRPGSGFLVCATVPGASAGGGWTAVCPYSGWVNLRRCVGSRNRPLAALTPGLARRSFPAAGVPLGAGCAGAVLLLCPLGTSWPARAGPRDGPLPARLWHLTAGKDPQSPDATRAANPPGHGTTEEGVTEALSVLDARLALQDQPCQYSFHHQVHLRNMALGGA
jgi:hypothetical protein